jgi:hypothetical protein
MTLAATFVPRILALALLSAGAVGSAEAAPPPAAPGQGAEHARIVEHWTPARRAAAIPRDFLIDERGFGYMKLPGGALRPYGHDVGATSESQRPMAKPGGGGTVSGKAPVVTGMDPSGTAAVGASYTFKATVTDDGAIRSVTFRVGPQGGRQQSFSATGSGSTYSATISGFTNGTWTWSVVAKDNANLTTTSSTVVFTVNTSAGGGGGGGVIANTQYTGGGAIQNAVGRIYFEMPSNPQRTTWGGYVCSGTVVTDTATGRSVIQTAAHCVYDDANKAFARRVLFIPNQDGTIGAGTDRNCTNDPLGCWTTAFGVVDADWTTRTFPDNIPWDYAYYVVNDSGAYTAGLQAVTARLDGAVTPMTVSFATPQFSVANSDYDYTHALGYSYSDDPNFMYCAQDMTQLDASNWWLGSCGLSGGSSGGPWIQPLANGAGPLISVNSWGYTNQPGMAGPKLGGTSAQCVFNAAQSSATTPLPAPAGDGNEGYVPQGC